MKTFALSLASLFLLLGTQAQADLMPPSTDPCLPVRPANPNEMTCFKDGKSYDITVFSQVSDYTHCPYEKWQESKRALVIVTDRENKPLAVHRLYNGQFTYTYGEKFQAPTAGLDLDECIAPMNGGGITFGQ